MKKKLLVGTMALCLTASLFGCGGNNGTTTGAPTTGDVTTGEVTTETVTEEATTAQ